ncbi:MAG TPA: farnesyl diphosphate synthase [Pararhizobium sp.]|nr:farnesyl diphosphate synthase [Pararhizobium sp.]
MDEVSFDITRHLAANAEAVERLLADLLSDEVREGEVARPEMLMAAIRHGALNGGKRLRPFLVMESTRLLGGPEGAALRVAAALECVHCYSLIHDDLPAMDDDAVRRGRPTVHVAFDDATAILAGDGLQALAFDIISSPETRLPAEAKVGLVSALSRAAGIGGMVGGQALDLAAEIAPPDEAGVLTLQAMKTGALIRFACEAGAIIAGGAAEDCERLRRFGGVIGLAFQLADDLLDVTASAEDLGKATGKDAGRGKGTLVGLKGIDWARRRLDTLVEEAASLLSPYGARALPLAAAARFVAERRN